MCKCVSGDAELVEDSEGAEGLEGDVFAAEGAGVVDEDGGAICRICRGIFLHAFLMQLIDLSSEAVEQVEYIHLFAALDTLRDHR